MKAILLDLAKALVTRVADKILISQPDLATHYEPQKTRTQKFIREETLDKHLNCLLSTVLWRHYDHEMGTIQNPVMVETVKVLFDHNRTPTAWVTLVDVHNRKRRHTLSLVEFITEYTMEFTGTTVTYDS